MGESKKCYDCFTKVDVDAEVCPRCRAKLGPRLESGRAAKPGSPLLKIFFVLAALAIAGKAAVYSYQEKAAPGKPAVETVTLTKRTDPVKDGVIRKIKEKGAKELRIVGVTDIGYVDDTLCVYVDQRFSNLSRPQQEQLLGIMAGEWHKAIGKETTKVKVLEYGTDRTIAELVV